MRPTDLALLRTPGVPTVSPDGRTAVVAVTRLDLDADEYRSQLWTVPTDGSAPARPLTHGHRDTAPAWSPDGRWLAYLGAESGGKPQLHLLPTGGGQARRLTDHPLGAGAPVWSPDSRRLAYTARVPEPGRYGTAEDVPPAAEPPRLITTLAYRSDDVGFTTDRRPHVFVMQLTDDDAADLPTPVQITDGDADDADPAWSPDGTRLAFVSARHPGADRDLVRDVYVVDADGGEPRRVTGSRADCSKPAWTPDGGTIVVTAIPDLGPDGLDFVARNETVARVDAAGGELEPLLDPEQHGRGDETPGTVVADGAVLVGVERRGAVELLRVPLDGGEPETLVDGDFTVRGFAVGRGVVVATVAHDRSAGELIAITPGAKRLLTGFGSALQATGRLHRMRETTATAPDGYPVHGWVTTPEGPGPHPVLLMVHGGPYSQYGWTLLDETQTAVTAGYAVLQCNPRGSSGYGQAHGRVVKEHLGELDAADVLAFLDAALEDPALDGERVGILGGSYGGYMTTLLLGRTTRFTAAISERGFNDPVSFVGSSDIGFFFADGYVGTDPERITAQSAMAGAHRISTPTMVVHSEEDWRCPLEQGTRLYVELQRRGVPTELLLFPGEGHELTRTGRPAHRLARFEHVLRWWARWLPTEQDRPDPEPVTEAAPAPPATRVR
ncbi:prolyl oligopeptidase family serine peptidase [Modestobacter sp. I12A-02628]|uniref:S9 family peptidase n=1 Tax=Goekera deserti TaxID=2497753 RepID=A0A7K3WDN9_9ACTN|nr:S9 family peptidase [Goekera deserti]MPQ96808.1 prolyl oligopeptidase family serine peptidase [Goekera deserti]NDI46878.1 prolyl oligopeptidase family serine peptidase [Goekera deserti]NEL54446.1 S9 family peptidase [Goekera deserti]